VGAERGDAAAGVPADRDGQRRGTGGGDGGGADLDQRQRIVARREFDMGELGERRRLARPVLAGLGGLLLPDLLGYAARLGIDASQFRARLDSRAGAARVAEDTDSADLSGVTGTPTFFINGRRHYGSYDITELTAAVQAAKAASLDHPLAGLTARRGPAQGRLTRTRPAPRTCDLRM
jgi:DSBA-like thioredoxin domain-containing protein